MLDKSPFCKAQAGIERDNEMVQYLDINQRQSLFESLGQKLVGVARLCDARGVVMRKDHRCRIEGQPFLEDFARVNAGLR